MAPYCVPPVADIVPEGLIALSRGRYAPAHLGELGALLPPELVDAVLEEHGGRHSRLRDLPSRCGVYFVLAMCLFPEVGYGLVWRKLTAALGSLSIVDPTAKALRDLRRRIGIAPMRALYETVAGPLAQPSTPGVRHGRYRTVSFDGCSAIRLPDSGANRAAFGRHGGWPMLRLMTLVETGTRALIGSCFGPPSEGEAAYARRLLHLLTPDMLVLWDKGFDGNDFLAETCATGAKVLGRLKSNRITPVLSRLDDDSYLSRLGTVTVRVIEAQITVTCADKTTFTGSYRLITTLTDPRRHPARTLVSLYHERWEHESAYYALRHTLMNSRVLRSKDPAGVEQEVWATLTLYQLLRTAMVDAVETRPDIDPDRAGFTVALQAARDQLILAAPATGGLGRATEIGRRVLDSLLPARRPRVSTRKVKSTTVRYAERLNDGRPDRSTPITRLTTEVLPPPERSEYPETTTDERTLPRASPQRRSEKIIAFLHSEADRTWSAKELSRLLGDITVQSIYRQLSRLADRGLIIKAGPAAYTLPTPLTAAEIP